MLCCFLIHDVSVAVSRVYAWIDLLVPQGCSYVLSPSFVCVECTVLLHRLVRRMGDAICVRPSDSRSHSGTHIPSQILPAAAFAKPHGHHAERW